MKLIVWLWNPWNEYNETRHNIWFMFLDYLKDKLKLDDFKLEKKFFAEISVANINSEKIIFAKPITFMNKSWISVSTIANFYKINISDVYIIYDDISLDFWKIRYRQKWSAWWHNWIKSIISHLWDWFKRIKIWVWNNSQYDLANWVLSKFTNSEIIDLESDIFKESKELLENNL